MKKRSKERKLNSESILASSLTELRWEKLWAHHKCQHFTKLNRRCYHKIRKSMINLLLIRCPYEFSVIPHAHIARSLAHYLLPTCSLQIANRPANLAWNITMNETNNFGKQYFGSFNVNHWKNGWPQLPPHTNTFAKVFVSFHLILCDWIQKYTYIWVHFICLHQFLQ